MVNVNKLKAKIVEKGMNIDELAKFSGLSKAKIYRRFKHPTEITVAEVDKMSDVLDIDEEEARSIFFARSVS